MPTSSLSGPVESKGLWFDSLLETFIRRGDAAGDLEPAECNAGDEGFVLARFEGEGWITTKMSVLQWQKFFKSEPKPKAKGKAKAKRKAKAKAAGVLKRPASSLSSEPAAVTEPGTAVFCREYRKSSNAYAIRKKCKKADPRAEAQGHHQIQHGGA